jgi:ABC-2 type transport system ATP-binding protein
MDKPAAAASAQGWLERFGLETRSDDPVEALSHGNQQRVQLAAALVHDPDLLVLDEPFSGLDPLAVETMSHVLRELAEAGKAVVFSSHQLDLVEDLCEEVAIINEGHVVVEGNVRALKDASPIRHIEVDVDVDGALDGLLETLDHVRSHTVDGTVHTLTISSDTDIRGFLGRAEATGRLRHFTYTSPSLSELFRDAVG